MMRLTAASVSVLALARARPLSEVEGMFTKFLEEDEKVYEELEHKARFSAFTENLEFIERENAKGHTYKLGLTQFADMTNDEFAMTYMGYRPSTKQWGDLPYLGSHHVGSDPVPDSMDWREMSAVTAVKNQGQCGSCWAFSTTGSLEGAWAIASGSLVSFSEQQLVDCSKKFGEMGCSGGSMDGGFQYAHQTNMCTEDSYPYQAKNSICKQAGCSVGLPMGGVVGFKDVKVDDPTALMSAVAQQPVSVAIEADKMAFQLYKSGVLSKACGNKLDHGVLAVGYGTEDGTDYWLVKNSWGAQWGMDGYVKIARAVPKEGECGINMDPSYPVVKKVAPAPGPSPGPAPAPVPASGEYEKPPCAGDEVEAQVQGADGVLCAPPCDGMMSCPDAPRGTKAEPQCVLSDSASGKKFCALTCHLSSSCPEGATCASLGFTGICVYPSDATVAPKAMSIDSSEAIIAV